MAPSVVSGEARSTGWSLPLVWCNVLDIFQNRSNARTENPERPLPASYTPLASGKTPHPRKSAQIAVVWRQCLALTWTAPSEAYRNQYSLRICLIRLSLVFVKLRVMISGQNIRNSGPIARSASWNDSEIGVRFSRGY